MRVGLVVYGGLNATSGGYLYNRRLVAHLRNCGDRVDVVSLPRRSYPRLLLDNYSLRLRRRLARPFDVLVQDELCHPSLVLHNRRRDDAAPIVAIVHSLRAAERRGPVASRWYRAVEGRYLRSVDATVSTSRATETAVDRLADVPGLVARPGRGHRDPSLSNEEITARARREPLQVVFVGNVVPRKEVRTLVEGLARLPPDDWRLTVVGSLDADPGYAAKVRQTVDRMGVDDAVSLAGRLPDDAVADHLRRGHLLAIPSRYEAYGIASLEGMGFGLPALATTAGGADELVVHGENGYLVPPTDPAAVARAVHPLLDDRDRLVALSLAARETYEAHPTWTQTSARVRTFLQRLAGDRG